MPENLGLDEALVSVNRSSPIALESLEVYYQIGECFGCPLEKLPRLNGSLAEFVINTKHELQLELRQQQILGNGSPGKTLCHFNNLSLNDHGHYRIDFQQSGQKPSSSNPANNSTGFDCSIQTLDRGACSLCPPAIILCLIFLITAGEKVYSRLLSANRRHRRNGTKAAAQQQQDGSDNATVSVAVEPNTAVGSSGSTNGIATNQQVNDASENAGNSTAAAQEAAADQLDEAIAVGEQATRADETTTNNANNKSADQNNTRIEALDTFRGLTIAGMILVNYGGGGYALLEHKAWDGITLADFVFPFFIFSMGASIAISSKSMKKRGKSFPQILMKIIRRSFLLMALGLCLNSRWLGERSFGHLRLTGVLQRFSVSYLIVASMYSAELATSKWIKAQSLYRVPMLSKLMGVVFELLTALNYLSIYLYVTYYYEYSPTCPAGYTGPGGQTEGGRFADCTGGAAAWLDRLVLGERHLYNDTEVRRIFKTQVTHDPEGILGYTTSILLTLIGLQCGKILVRFKNHKLRLLLLSQWLAALTASCVLVVAIPINKRLWSLTFITLTGAAAYLTISLLYILIDVYQCERTFFLRLLSSAGKNAISLYVGHSLLNGMLPWYFAVDETSHLQLLLRVAWSTFVWLVVAHYMARKRLLIRL